MNITYGIMKHNQPINLLVMCESFKFHALSLNARRIPVSNEKENTDEIIFDWFLKNFVQIESVVVSIILRTMSH